MISPAQGNGDRLTFEIARIETKYSGKVKGSSGIPDIRPKTKASEEFLIDLDGR